MEYKWKILEIFANDTVITGCKYHLTGTEGEISVETEGNYYFNEPSEKVPFAEVTESTIISWLEQEAIFDGKNHIKLGLEKQINTLKTHKPTVAPWLSDTFTVE